MPFKKAPQCKICKSTIRDKIDLMLIKGESSSIIIPFAKRHSLKLNPYNISVHNRKHRAITPKDLLVSKSTKEAERRHKKQIKQMVNAQAVLQLVIDNGFDEIKQGNLKPSIMECLKAIELQMKAHAGSPMEQAVINFISGISIEHSN